MHSTGVMPFATARTHIFMMLGSISFGPIVGPNAAVPAHIVTNCGCLATTSVLKRASIWSALSPPLPLSITVHPGPKRCWRISGHAPVIESPMQTIFCCAVGAAVPTPAVPSTVIPMSVTSTIAKSCGGFILSSPFHHARCQSCRAEKICIDR